MKKKEISAVEKYITDIKNKFLSDIVYNLTYHVKNGDGRIFYDDDVYYYLNSHSVPKALDELKNK